LISVVIGTYGSYEKWAPLARRAMASVEKQTVAVEAIHVHADTLADARNIGARRTIGERLVFLDADDWLAPDFCEKIVEPEDVLQPMTVQHRGGYQTTLAKYMEPREDLLDGNHRIVGCPVDREVFMEVGGFDEWPIYEDWALWLKIRAAGGSFGKTTGVYNIELRDGSRNSGPAGDTFDQIRSLYS